MHSLDSAHCPPRSFRCGDAGERLPYYPPDISHFNVRNYGLNVLINSNNFASISRV